MAGKVTVGTVYLKVQPDLDGFRRKVEQGTKGLDDIEIDVSPDMDGFRQKVKSATKGMKAEVDVVADTKRMIADTKAAMKKISDDAQRGAKLRLMADFAHASADRRLKKFMDKANATSVVRLKVADLDKSQVSKVSDQIERVVSRDPVKIRFAVQRDQLNRAMDNVRTSLKKFGPGTQRYIQLSLGTSPKDSGSQRKMLAYLDQVKSKIDKLKKPTASPFEQWDGKKLKPLTVGVGDLERAVNQLKNRTDDSWKLNDLRVRKGDTSALSDQLKELHKIDEQFKKLHQRSKETGDAFPTGYLDLTKQVTKYQKDLAQLDKARGKMMDKWTREAYKPVDYGNVTPDLLKRLRPLDNLVHKQTMREIRKEQLLRNQAVASAVRGYKKVADSATKASQKVSEETVKSIQRTKEQYTKSREALRGVNLLPKSIQRQMRLANAIDPGGKVSGSKAGQLADRLSMLRNQLDRYKDAASSVASETRRVVSENRKAASSFSKLNKKTKNTGFGGKRRRGLKSIDEVGTERFAGLSRIGWMVSAIAAIAAPAVQLVSGLAAALPALGGVALAALGVTLLGLDGIKEAAQAAAPALERAKEAVSGVFQQRMTPQFAQLGNLLDRISPQLETMAHGMSDFSQGLVDGLTSKTGTASIQELLTNSADLFSRMKPFAQDFTEGLLQMAGAGSQTFPALADGMNRFGSAFKRNVSELSDSGQLQDAIQATYDVVGNLGMNLGRILRAGIETAPSMSASLEPLFDGLTDGIVDIMPLLSSFSEFVGPTLGSALAGIGDIATQVTPGLSEFFGSITPGTVDLFAGLGDAIGAIASPFANLLGAVGPGVGDVFSAAGEGLTDLANAIRDAEGLDSTATGLGDAISQMLSKTMAGAGYGHDLKLNAIEVQEGLEMYGNAFTRFITGSMGQSGLIRSAVNDILTSLPEVTGNLDKTVSGIVESFEKAEQALQIDLQPQIKAINSAATLEEAGEIVSEVVNMIKSNSAPSTKVEPEITVDPRIDMAGAVNALQAGATGPFADLTTAIDQFKVNAEAIAGEVGIDITPQINVLEGVKTTGQFSSAAQRIMERIKAEIDTAPTEIEPNLTVNQTAPVDTSGVTEGVSQQVQDDINAALTGIDIDMSTAASSIGSQLGDALGGVDVPVDGLMNNLSTSITTAIEGMSGEIASSLSSLTSEFSTAGSEAATSYADGISSSAGEATTAASTMATNVQGALKLDMFASGAAIGESFAAGIESKTDRVKNAALALAAAADLPMPQSPAKIGPFSGKGWVLYSGMSIGDAFADGMLSKTKIVGDAATELMSAASSEINDFQLDPVGNMEAFKKDAVLQPVLESNAKKIADYRKREAERAEKHNERLAKIDENKSKADKKEEQRVKARESLAKQSAESYEKLLESLETPDYGKIDRSIQGYWIDGYKDVFKEALKSSMSASDFTGSLQRAVKGATSYIREYLGDHPILTQVEANVDAEAFHWAVYEAIEESGIHEVPINLAIANVDQFKRDLGMGDGVLSRALDQAISFDPGRSDARRYEEQKEEVHYHVTDMEEAIRLHQQMQRKELMKIPR